MHIYLCIIYHGFHTTRRALSIRHRLIFLSFPVYFSSYASSVVWDQNQNKHNFLCITTQLWVHSKRVARVVCIGNVYVFFLLFIVSLEPRCPTVIHIFECLTQLYKNIKSQSLLAACLLLTRLSTLIEARRDVRDKIGQSPSTPAWFWKAGKNSI